MGSRNGVLLPQNRVPKLCDWSAVTFQGSHDCTTHAEAAETHCDRISYSVSDLNNGSEDSFFKEEGLRSGNKLSTYNIVGVQMARG